MSPRTKIDPKALLDCKVEPPPTPAYQPRQKRCECGRRISDNKEQCWTCMTAAAPDAMEQFNSNPQRFFKDR